LLAARANLGCQPFRTADHEVDVACIEPPALDFRRQLLGAPRLAMYFERDNALAWLNLAQHGLAFLANQPRHVGVLATGIERDLMQLQR